MSPYASIIWGCNASCSYCFLNKDSRASKEMSLDDAEKLFKWLSERDVENMSLIGGEPTIHPEFNKITEIIGKNGIKASIPTNGLFGEDKREAFLQGVYTRVGLHINDVYFYEEDRFKLLRKNFEFLAETGIEIELRYVVHSAKIDTEFLIHAAEIAKAKIVNFSIARPDVYGRTAYLPFKSVRLAIPFISKAIDELREAGKTSYIVALYPKCVTLEYGDLFAGYDGEFCCRNEEGGFDTSFVINPDLTSSACMALSQIRTEKKVTEFNDLEEVKETFRERFEELRVIPLHEECLTCPYYNVSCQGGCLAYKIFK